MNLLSPHTVLQNTAPQDPYSTVCVNKIIWFQGSYSIHSVLNAIVSKILLIGNADKCLHKFNLETSYGTINRCIKRLKTRCLSNSVTFVESTVLYPAQRSICTVRSTIHEFINIVTTNLGKSTLMNCVIEKPFGIGESALSSQELGWGLFLLKVPPASIPVQILNFPTLSYCIQLCLPFVYRKRPSWRFIYKND